MMCANFNKTLIDLNMAKINESSRLYLLWAQKNSNLQNFLNQNENKGKPISNSKSWNKTNEKKNTTDTNKFFERFYYKEEIKTKQSYDQKMYLKLVFNRLK